MYLFFFRFQVKSHNFVEGHLDGANVTSLLRATIAVETEVHSGGRECHTSYARARVHYKDLSRLLNNKLKTVQIVNIDTADTVTNKKIN